MDQNNTLDASTCDETQVNDTVTPIAETETASATNSQFHANSNRHARRKAMAERPRNERVKLKEAKKIDRQYQGWKGLRDIQVEFRTHLGAMSTVVADSLHYAEMEGLLTTEIVALFEQATSDIEHYRKQLEEITSEVNKHRGAVKENERYDAAVIANELVTLADTYNKVSEPTFNNIQHALELALVMKQSQPQLKPKTEVEA